MSVQSPQVPCAMVSEGANVDTPVRADLASSNGPSMDVANSSALSLTTNSDPMPDTHITNPIDLGDVVLSIPNLSEVVARESPNECISEKPSVPASRSDNASLPISQGSPELSLVSEHSTNEAEGSLIHDTTHVHEAFATPSSGDLNASDQGNGISVISIPQSEFVSSEVKAKIPSREVEGSIACIGQLEFTPNIDAVECVGADEALRVDSIKDPSVRILVSKARYY